MVPSEFVERVARVGYDGVEIGFPDEDSAEAEIVRLAREAGLAVVAQHYATLAPDVRRHCEELENRLRRLAGYHPDFINSHTGRDFFDLESNLRVFDTAAQVAEESGIPIFHETHRARCLHTPWRTAELLRERPETRLVFDMSHWCNVCESLLEDQCETISGVLPAVAHIHARVGHPQGPQVADPRAPEWRAAVDVHLGWWDRIISTAREAGCQRFTIAPEFGPPPYFPTLPWTGAPVGSQWDTNLHMMRLLRERYAS